MLTTDEYIKRDYAVDAVLDVYCDTPDINLSCEKFEEAIRKIQAADVANVRHGRWIDGVCSACGFDAMYYKDVPAQVYTNFCPNCGCNMREVDHD